ncbi:hypothetical protein HCX48_11310 [Rhodocyclus tenuis]|uniref:Hsp70 family protein n=1 Tax=Rhodocyclus gracilis TaxID=2929842 RepID=A0ABX0WJS6_9RHOO|nr:hypothetical protein [Rhodocyclus gracilis]NJA89807.1 hypothetical protein [Rhodocyclus gracilis]
MQCHGKDFSDEREVVLGLDFGTSAAKVVIGDAALGKAFAVPFADQMGIERYLLPCRLYESDGVYSLHRGDQTHRDLKLALIAEPTDATLQARVVAFLALVIRHARGWLFAQHADIYRTTHLVWKLVVGLPAATHLKDDLSLVFAETSLAAWLVAGGPEFVDRQSVDAALLRSRELTRSLERRAEAEDVEVDVVPEIAAQIYGFVNSTSFDKKAENLFLMVDVGAGSVDSSLFHVRPARGGKWDFEFFTSVVEPHGAMNLHRHRIRWWEEALSKPGVRADGLAQALNRLKFPTDRLAPLPNGYSSYFDDVTVTFDDNRKDPDETFFAKKVLTQVRGQTYWRTWKDGFLPQSSLRGIPVFFCGGGTRIPFYQRLRGELQSMPNFSWLKATPRVIDIPQNLEAPGLLRDDFDRLTVAYGLSFLEVGKITKSIPQPKITVNPVSSWRESYVDKDHC